MILNIHERSYPDHTEAELGALLDTMGGPDDRLWPTTSGNFPPMRLDGPLSTLPAGGHGFVRYHTVDYQPSRSITWRFDDGLGIEGTHRADVVTGPNGPMLRHTLEGRPVGSFRVVWPLAVRWLHDACLEELLDQADASLTGRPVRPRRHSAWVRFLLRRGPSPAAEERHLSHN